MKCGMCGTEMVRELDRDTCFNPNCVFSDVPQFFTDDYIDDSWHDHLFTTLTGREEYENDDVELTIDNFNELRN